MQFISMSDTFEQIELFRQFISVHSSLMEQSSFPARICTRWDTGQRWYRESNHREGCTVQCQVANLDIPRQWQRLLGEELNYGRIEAGSVARTFSIPLFQCWKKLLFLADPNQPCRQTYRTCLPLQLWRNRIHDRLTEMIRSFIKKLTKGVIALNWPRFWAWKKLSLGMRRSIISSHVTTDGDHEIWKFQKILENF